MANETQPGGLAGLKRILFDVLAGWLFLAVFLATNDIFLATGAGLVAGLGQAVWMISKKQKIDPMQWMAMILVVGLGGATMVTRNPTFVVFKPSIFEAGLVLMMLRPGWMVRYAPARTRELIPGLMVAWGYVWAAAWLALAASNLVVARVWGLKAWAIYTNISPFGLLGVLFLMGLLVLKPAALRTARARGIVLSSPRVAG